MAAKRIAIIGFGFSGLMVTAQLVRRAEAGTVIYGIAPDFTSRGTAYDTANAAHLLNVPAAKMGAFPEAVDDFVRWLNGAQGALARQRLGIAQPYDATDFVPRALYGSYLTSLWQETQQQAAARGVFLKLVETTVTGLAAGEPVTVTTARGDAIAVDGVVCATGNEGKRLTEPHALDPWNPDSWSGAKQWAPPVLLLGSGLTAVDAVLSLRSVGYAHEIIALSRHGRLPCAHAAPMAIVTFQREELLAQPSLLQLLRFLRRKITETGDWRAVIDALRPHTPFLWQRFSTGEQRQFQRHLASVWNIHRHRMAPQIAARMQEEIASGGLRLIANRDYRWEEEAGMPVLVCQTKTATERLTPSRVIHCVGPELTLTRSRQSLWQQALATGGAEPHATGAGLAVDPQLRVWGNLHPYIYAMGNLAAGQLLESTAVPELRQQAEQIAIALSA